MRCEECGGPASAGVCAEPHLGVDCRRYVERSSGPDWYAPATNAIVEQLDGDDGVMTRVHGVRMWRVRGDLEWMRRRVAAGCQATPAHTEAEMRKAIDRIVE